MLRRRHFLLLDTGNLIYPALYAVKITVLFFFMSGLLLNTRAIHCFLAQLPKVLFMGILRHRSVKNFFAITLDARYVIIDSKSAVIYSSVI